jgi:hypothetical protein
VVLVLLTSSFVENSNNNTLMAILNNCSEEYGMNHTTQGYQIIYKNSNKYSAEHIIKHFCQKKKKKHIIKQKKARHVLYDIHLNIQK